MTSWRDDLRLYEKDNVRLAEYHDRLMGSVDQTLATLHRLAENTHLSIGLAGSLHLHRPPDIQLQAAARVCKWVIDNKDIPQVNSIDRITGHDQHYATACPGWLGVGEGAPSGDWRDAFYDILRTD